MAEETNSLRDLAEMLLAGLRPVAVDDEDLTDRQGRPYIVIPEDYKVFDLEQMLQTPRRDRSTVTLQTEVSFCRFVMDHKRDNSRIYATMNPTSFTCVFDESTAETPLWGDKRAVWKCPFSAEWGTWSLKNNVQMKQVDFAQFIEDNLPDIVDPPGGDMLEIARTLEARKKVNFASSIRLDNGQNQLTYEEEIQGTASKGLLRLPDEFTIAIPVHHLGPKYAVTARLRYRIPDGGGHLTMWYALLRPQKIEEAAVLELVERIGATTGVPILFGVRPS